MLPELLTIPRAFARLAPMTTTPFKHREAWLQAAAGEIREWFKVAEVEVPQLHISTGWSKRAGKGIGWCWRSEHSADGVNQIFISPELGDPEGPQGVLATLVHEMVHASDDGESKHSGHFRRTALQLGLEGKMTATRAGQSLMNDIHELSQKLGEYPHAPITPGASGKIGKDGTRMLKLQCPTCDWSCRTTKKWIEQGLPTCFCGTELEVK
jgi:hypothetical protein